MKPNVKNRTIFTRDNLEVMRGIEPECIDLIYLDPPFNSKHNYAAPIGSKAAGAEFKDTWTLSDIDNAWWGQIAEKNTALYKILDAAGSVGGGAASTKSYLIYMSIRLLQMHRILKETGSLYLHCDPTMSHYLKCILDAIFGPKNFRNEIIWYYRGAGISKRTRAKRHDVILWYAKSDNHYFDPDPIRQEYAEATKERFVHKIGNVRDGRDYGQQSLNPLGKHPDDVITNIQPIAPSAKARLGYPTQKPVELLCDLVSSTSQKDDMVLDPFCGCATTCLAAEKLDRQWVGIDISPKAYDLINSRLLSESKLDRFLKDKEGRGWNVIHRTDIPERDAKRSKDIKHTLFGAQMGICNGCDHDYLFKDLEVDHIIPVSKGGINADSNLQLLCGNCNRIKGGKRTMEELWVKLEESGLRKGKGRIRRFGFKDPGSS